MRIARKTIILDTGLIKRVEEIAKEENRSFGNMI